jgi:hypothetical protein
MPTVPPAVLALDFDGVVCDGRAEYFESARRAYEASWPGARASAAGAAAGLRRAFEERRPLIESGWEMPALYHALQLDLPRETFLDRAAWLLTARRLLAESSITAETLGRALNAARDDWFARDPDDWLAHHVFYPGIVARIETLVDGPTRAVIVTTKAERFVRALLAAQRPAFARLRIVGRDPARVVSKPETLHRLIGEHALPAGGDTLWFVEDLLETLESVHRDPRLGRVRLLLAGWGYNTLEDRAAAGWRAHTTLLTLSAFAADWAAWD